MPSSTLELSACLYGKYLVRYEFLKRFLVTLLSLRTAEVHKIIQDPTLLDSLGASLGTRPDPGGSASRSTSGKKVALCSLIVGCSVTQTLRAIC